jgi:hypothetical protein
LNGEKTREVVYGKGDKTLWQYGPQFAARRAAAIA